MEGISVETMQYMSSLHGADWSSEEKKKKLYELVIQCSREFPETKLLTVELGVFGGASLFCFAHAHKDLKNGYALGIDAWNNETPTEGVTNEAVINWWKTLPIDVIYNSFLASCEKEEWRGYTTYRKGQSDAFADEFADEAFTIINQDSNPTPQNIIRELEIWIPKLRNHGYWIANNTNWAEAKAGYAKLPDYGLELVEDFETWQIWKKVGKVNEGVSAMDLIRNKTVSVIKRDEREIVKPTFLIQLMKEVVEMNSKSQLLFGKIQPILLFLPDTIEWLEEWVEGTERFNKEGIYPFHVAGVHAKMWGITSNHKYLRDTWARLIHKYGNTLPTKMPDELKHPYYIGDGKVGGIISHYILYNVMASMDCEYFFVLEGDAIFIDGAMARIEQAIKDVPNDFDFLFIGSADAENKEPVHIKGDVWHFPNRVGKETWYPQTGFAYILAKKALPIILATQRDSSTPVDIQLIYDAFQYLNIYACLPRLAHQGETHLNP